MTPDLDAVRAMMEGVTMEDGADAQRAMVRSMTLKTLLTGARWHYMDPETVSAYGPWYRAEDYDALAAEVRAQREAKDGAYLERNKLVALLASLYPSGIKRTAIEGWSADWHGCVYIDFPWGQASWHYHDSHAGLFEHLPPYAGEWDGHTTEAKYDAIVQASRAQRETIAGLEARVEALTGALECVRAIMDTPIARRRLGLSTDDERLTVFRAALPGGTPDAAV